MVWFLSSSGKRTSTEKRLRCNKQFICVSVILGLVSCPIAHCPVASQHGEAWAENYFSALEHVILVRTYLRFRLGGCCRDNSLVFLPPILSLWGLIP